MSCRSVRAREAPEEAYTQVRYATLHTLRPGEREIWGADVSFFAQCQWFLRRGSTLSAWYAPAPRVCARFPTSYTPLHTFNLPYSNFPTPAPFSICVPSTPMSEVLSSTLPASCAAGGACATYSFPRDTFLSTQPPTIPK